MNHRRKKLLAISLSIIMMLTTFPLAAMVAAAESGGCDHDCADDCCSFVEDVLCDDAVCVYEDSVYAEDDDCNYDDNCDFVEAVDCDYVSGEDCGASARQTVSDTVVIASFEALPCHVAWQQFAPPILTRRLI